MPNLRRSCSHARIDNWAGLIVASDEVGYGAWAGPLVVCAASASRGWDDRRIQDSKLFDREKGAQEREALFEEFFYDPRFVLAVEVVPSHVIDRMGVGNALPLAHTAALKKARGFLRESPLGVVDGSLPVHTFEVGFNLVALPQADQLVPECSLASIIAKVTRDRMMIALDDKYPGYGFASHKGYGGNEAHNAALKKLGPCPEHRTSYEPIATILAERERAAQPRNAWELLDDG